MSDSEDVRLPKAAEALLADWPAPEHESEFWEKQADQIVAKAKDAEPVSDALLEAPLPAEEGEPGADGDAAAAAESADVEEVAAVEPEPMDDEAEAVEPEPMDDEAEAAVAEVEPDDAEPEEELPTMPRASEPPPRSGLSLAEMARQSLAEEKKEQDAKDIARESLSLASRSRASVPDLAEAIRASRPPPPPSSAPASVPASGEAAESKPASAAAPKRSMGPVIAITAAALGIAAAVLILVRTQGVAEPSSVAEAPVAAQPAQAAKPAARAAEEAKAKSKDDGTLTFDDLGAEGEAKSAEPKPTAGAAKVASAKDEPKKEAQEEEPAEDGPPKEKIVLAEEDEEAQKMKPADSNNAPLEPGKGAVQAAIGAVLGGARACVAGHDSPSRATVTFGSNGRVQGVAVSGPAAGTPAEGCIRAALSQARVQPFQKPSYTAGLTIRPN